MKRYLLNGIDGVCETLRVEPPWLFDDNAIQSQSYTSSGRFQTVLEAARTARLRPHRCADARAPIGFQQGSLTDRP